MRALAPACVGVLVLGLLAAAGCGKDEEPPQAPAEEDSAGRAIDELREVAGEVTEKAKEVAEEATEKAVETAEEATEAAKDWAEEMSSDDASGPCMNGKCPIMGTTIDPDEVADDLTREWRGLKVGFCCAGCPVAWDKLSDEEKLARLAASDPSGELPDID